MKGDWFNPHENNSLVTDFWSRPASTSPGIRWAIWYHTYTKRSTQNIKSKMVHECSLFHLRECGASKLVTFSLVYYIATASVPMYSSSLRYLCCLKTIKIRQLQYNLGANSQVSQLSSESRPPWQPWYCTWYTPPSLMCNSRDNWLMLAHHAENKCDSWAPPISFAPNATQTDVFDDSQHARGVSNLRNLAVAFWMSARLIVCG